LNRISVRGTVKEKALLMKYVGVISLLGIILTIGLNIEQTNGAAETETQHLTIPIEDATVSGNCPGHESIEHVNGELKIVAHTTTDPTGGFHSKVQIVEANLKGVGVDSGDEYTITGIGGHTFNIISDDVPFHDTQTTSGKITDGDSEKVRVNLEFSVNANGEVTVDKANFETVCD
jgi:hypothetical protein